MVAEFTIVPVTRMFEFVVVAVVNAEPMGALVPATPLEV